MLVLATAYLLIVAPLLDTYSQRKALLADRQMMLPRLNRVVEELPRLRAQLAELQATANTRPIVLQGASDALASANLQSRIEELAGSAGATIGSTEALAAEDRTPYRRIGLRVAVNGTYDAIVRLLGSIEATTPPLVLGNLQIHGALRATSQPSGARLDAGFEVFGFRGADTPAAAQK